MRVPEKEIEISLDALESGLKLCIFPERENSIYQIDEEEANNEGEAPYQLLEGNFYNYYFKNSKGDNHNYQLVEDTTGIIKRSKRQGVSQGRISPNIYVGSLNLDIYSIIESPDVIKHSVCVEILATKLNNKLDNNYRENYRFMLNDITEKCTELLLQINSPITQNLVTDFDKDSQTIYQRFAFVKSLIESDDFNAAIHKIISSPTSKWKETIEFSDIRSVRRMNGSSIRQIVSGSNRIKLPQAIGKLNDIPSKIAIAHKIETIDTAENRFIKYVLETLSKFCSDCRDVFYKQKNYFKSIKEANLIIELLDSHLNQPFFREINRPTTLKLNSPALQRKSGYREVLKVWLQFDLAAKLIWRGGDDVYKAGKRDIAVLYEYWLFFVLYDLIKAKFNLNQHTFDGDAYEHLIDTTKDELNVMLKSGKQTALEGIVEVGNRKFAVRFSYNREFSGGVKYEDSKDGSWTSALRPDYTLSFWPSIYKKDKDAEKAEEIVHIHFDSKYKVDQFIINTKVEAVKDDETGETVDSLEIEKREQRKGVYKNADLLKMHAYKDAIRRTMGAYILYPGTENKPPYKGYHEIIPGLGAFAIRPNNGDNGIEPLSKFMDDVIEHFSNMASQQRRFSRKSYDIHEQKPGAIVKENMPEFIIPDETYVLVGYSRSEERTAWYDKNEKYNFRMDDDAGSLILEGPVVNAKYLLLRKKDEKIATDLYRIISKGPKVFSKVQLEKMKYPPIGKLKEYYLVIDIEKVNPTDFGNVIWRFKELEAYKKIKQKNKDIHKSAGIPFIVSLSELMGVVERV